MRVLAAAGPVLLGSLLVSCSARAPFQVVDRPDGLTCVSLEGHMGPDQVGPQLLFIGAEAALERGGRSFRVVARTTHSYPPPGPGEVDISKIAVEGGLLCFEVLSGPSEGPGTFDAVRVVTEADPALRKTLSAGALRALEAAKAGGTAPDGLPR